jgi:hypothetical protein
MFYEGNTYIHFISQLQYEAVIFVNTSVFSEN